MPSSERYEMKDYNSETNLTMSSKQGSGCYVSAVVGFILVLLAVILAVGVGIIVHFAGDKDLVCKCDMGSGMGDAASAEAVKQECVNMAAQGNEEICQKCPSMATPKPTDMAPTPAPTSKPKVTDVRLPTSVMPVRYSVEIQPDMYTGDPKTFTFKGSVKIVVRCDEPTDNITLHVNVLTVTPSSIRFRGESPMSSDPQYLNYETDLERQFFILKLTKNMIPGRQYVVEMAFTSPLRDDLKGLYYSTYTENGQTHYLATTQFQPTDARKAFPCFDEPAIKATFNITLVRPEDIKSISNMPIIDSFTFEENGKTWVKDIYQETPKMSTYLLAFIFSNFEYTQNTTANNVLYRAWATPASVNQTFYGLDVGVKVLTYFEDYFGIRYPLPKQDMAAVPDFEAGAMENWGLIIYRETAMLFKPGVSNEFNRQRVAIVVSHELAHQWFGDLVTPSWWDDLWLNEGFATFVEYLGVDFVHPDWNVFDTFVLSEVHSAMSADGLVSSHPLYVPVGHPDEINEIFDSISYAKGGSVIRMMRHFLGFDTFKRGLNRYLESRAYDAAFHDDLWSALTMQAKIDRKNIDVKAVMDTWTLQMNYPVVTVTRDFNDVNVLNVRQDRYLQDPDAEELGVYEAPFDYHWTIPLTFTSSKNPFFNQTDLDVKWLYKEDLTKTFDIGQANLPTAGDTNGWILANVNQNGYYRVNYNRGNWQALSNQLKNSHQVIPTINRAQIINDAWNLAKGQYVPLDTALMTIEYLDKERDYIPWSAAVRELSYVADQLSLTSTYGQFERFMKEKLNPSFTFYTLDNTGASHTETYARELISSQACKYGIKGCTDSAVTEFKRWMDNPQNNPIDPNLKSIIYCNAIGSGGWEEWKFALEMYKNATVASEKATLLGAMSCSKKPWILNNYMSIILEETSPIRKQDAVRVIRGVAGSSIGRPLAWNFFRSNYDKLKELFGATFFSWSSLIRTVMADFNTQFEYDEAAALMEMKKGELGSGERAFSQGLEKIQSNIKWMAKNHPVIAKWLTDGGY